ncbi:uncharacterized protein LOC135816287 [Sycon ciliatum]|uniref:uncharacterized protein LOC135816287 n=1 Tax=Sycon ciliatum TaxID=27933 RepID=UPI0031F6DA38
MARLAALMRYFIFYVHLSALVTELQAADCKWPLDKLVVDFHFSPTDLSESAAQRPLSLSLTVRGQVYGDVTWASPSRILTDDDIDMLQVTTRPSEPCFKSWLVTIKGGTEVASDPFQHWNVTVYRDSARTVARTFRTSGTMRLFDAVHDLCNSTLPRFRCENKGVCYNADTKPREPAEVKALWGSFPRQNPLVHCSCPPGFHGDRCEIACNQQVQPAQSGVVTITVNTSCPLNYTDPDNLLVAAGATGPGGGQASCPSVAPGGAFQLYMGSVAQSDAGMVTCGGHSYNVIVQYPQSYDLTSSPLACLHNKPQWAPCQLGQCVQVSWTDPHLVTCPLKQSNPPGSLTWTVADPAKGGCFNSTTNLISSNPCNWPRGAYRSYPTAEAIKDACDSSGDPGVCDPDPCLLALNKSSKSTATRNVTSETTGWNDLGVGCQAFSACYRCTLTSMFGSLSYDVTYSRQKNPCSRYTTRTFKFQTGGSTISNASFVRCGIVEGSACPQAPGGVLPAYQVIERANGSLVSLTVSLLVNEMDPQEIGIVWYRTGQQDQYTDNPEFHQPGGSPCYISLTWTFTANNRTAGNYSVQFAHEHYHTVQLRQIMELKVPEHGCSLKTFKFETGGSAISNASFVRCGIVEGSDCPQAQGGVLPAYQVIERANGSQSPVELTVSILAAFDDIVILWYLNGVEMPSDPATFFVPKESDGLVRCYIVSTLIFSASDLTAGNYSVRFSRDNSLVNLSQIMELKLTHPGEGPATTAGPPTNSTPQVTPDSNTARVIVIASSAGGGALLFIVVIVSVCVCRRKRAASRGLTITDGGSDYLHKSVTWRQLSHLAEFLSVDWQHFVADLGLEEYQIRTCIGEYPQSINEQARKALRIWFQGISSDASQTWTVSKLMDRLHENNLQSVADNWKMRIGGGKNDQQGSSATRPLGVNADKERSMDDNGSILQRLLDVDNYDSGNGSPLALSCGK